MTAQVIHTLLCIVLWVLHLPGLTAMNEFKLTDLCSKMLEAQIEHASSFQLAVPGSASYAQSDYCGVHIRAPEGNRLFMNVKYMNSTMGEPCVDFIDIFDGSTPNHTVIPLLEGTCEGSPTRDLATTDRDVYIGYRSESRNIYHGFQIMFTVFNEGLCRGFSCSNGRCIDAALTCDNSDHCGDNSNNADCPVASGDDKELSSGRIVGTVLFVIVIAIAACAGCWCTTVKNHSKQRRTSQYDFPTVIYQHTSPTVVVQSHHFYNKTVRAYSDLNHDLSDHPTFTHTGVHPCSSRTHSGQHYPSCHCTEPRVVESHHKLIPSIVITTDDNPCTSNMD